jgi:hypothetical protein
VVVFGIVLVVVMAFSVAIVIALFLWAAREDGREQERINARLRRGRR